MAATVHVNFDAEALLDLALRRYAEMRKLCEQFAGARQMTSAQAACETERDDWAEVIDHITGERRERRSDGRLARRTWLDDPRVSGGR